MCNFLSALWTRDGRLLTAPEHTDSHSDLVATFGVHERLDGVGAIEQNFVRLEFSPPTDWSLDLDRWSFKIDEEERPGWFDSDAEAKAKAQMRTMVERMIVRDNRPMLLGGCWILTDKARVDKFVHCRIPAMLADSQVGAMWGSSQVGEMLGSSQVGVMWGSSRVGEMQESSRVGVMLGSSQVGVMWGSSRVGVMQESSRVGAMWESSRVGEMRGSSQAPRDPRKAGATP